MKPLVLAESKSVTLTGEPEDDYKNIKIHAGLDELIAMQDRDSKQRTKGNSQRDKL